MNIDWTHFTPWASLFGGLLLGLAVVIFLLVNGRVLGVSGILGGLMLPRRGDMGWRLAFLAGMAAAPMAFAMLAPPGTLPAPRIAAGYGTLIAAGLLVGLGTRYGSGCTSGHGVCGLARLSPRSTVATLSFMGSGFLTVYVVRHLL